MAKLKPPREEDVRVNVFPIRGRPPAVRVFLHRYEGDKNGEFIDHCMLDDGPDEQELALRIGRLVIASSPFIRAWLREQNP